VDVSRIYDDEAKELMGQFLVDVFTPNYGMISTEGAIPDQLDNQRDPVIETLYELTPVRNTTDNTLTTTFTLTRASRTSVIVSYNEDNIENGPDSYVDVSPAAVDVSKSQFAYSYNSGLKWYLSDSLDLSAGSSQF
jgi:hypothetical protein